MSCALNNANLYRKNVRKPNHHYFSKKSRNAPPICIAIRLQFVSQCFRCPIRSEERERLSVLLPFVSQYASYLYGNTPPIRIAVLLENLGGVVTGMFRIVAQTEGPIAWRTSLCTLDTHKLPNGLLRTPCGFEKVLIRRPGHGASVYRVHRNALLVGQLRAPWTHKPLNSLLRTLSRSQKVVRRPVQGFPFTGYTETLSK